MSDENNPTQGTPESQSAVSTGTVGQHMSEAEASQGIDNLVADMFGLTDTPPPSEDTEEGEEATESEESIEEEELIEDADVELHDEADDVEDDVEDSDQQGELEIVSYDDLKGYALEIGGENYTAAQLKSMIGRMKSAGENARKADQAVKDLEAREAQLAEQEQWIQQRVSAASQSDQLAEMQAEARKLNAKIEKARDEGDIYEIHVQKDKLEVLKNEYAQIKQQVDVVNSQAEQKSVAAAEQGLKDRGLGYLLEDSPQAKAWTAYASSKLSPQELRAVTLVPALAEAVEKARKYDAASKKTGSKLKSSGKTLKPGVGKTKTIDTASKKKKHYQENPDAYFLDLAKEVLGG